MLEHNGAKPQGGNMPQIQITGDYDPEKGLITIRLPVGGLAIPKAPTFIEAPTYAPRPPNPALTADAEIPAGGAARGCDGGHAAPRVRMGRRRVQQWRPRAMHHLYRWRAPMGCEEQPRGRQRPQRDRGSFPRLAKGCWGRRQGGCRVAAHRVCPAPTFGSRIGCWRVAARQTALTFTTTSPATT